MPISDQVSPGLEQNALNIAVRCSMIHILDFEDAEHLFIACWPLNCWQEAVQGKGWMDETLFLIKSERAQSGPKLAQCTL